MSHEKLRSLFTFLRQLLSNIAGKARKLGYKLILLLLTILKTASTKRANGRDDVDPRKPSGDPTRSCTGMELQLEKGNPEEISLHHPLVSMSRQPQSISVSAATSTQTLELPVHNHHPTRHRASFTRNRALGVDTNAFRRKDDTESQIPRGPPSLSITSLSRPHSIQTSAVSHKGPRLGDHFEDIVAISSGEHEKYEKLVVGAKNTYEELYIEPLMFFDDTRTLPPGWEAFTNPDGAPYFVNFSVTYNETSSTPGLLNLVTDVYMYEKHEADRLEGYVEKILDFIKRYQIDMPLRKMDLVLEFRRSGRCGYYFADHGHRTLFWLDDFDALDALSEVKVLLSPSHVAHEMTAFYWMHIEYFPHTHQFRMDMVKELKGMVIHALGDTITSVTSTSPYDNPTLEKVLTLIRNVEGESDYLQPVYVCVIGRLLYNFYHERFLNLYGERNARLERNQSIHPEPQRSYIMKLFSPLFLYGPEVHLRKLQQMSVDSLVHAPNWRSLLEKITEEWKEFTLFATVVLNANVAFLAIQSVDEGAPEGGRTSAQRASYTSIVTSVGAIVLGLLLVREHNTMLDRSFLAYRSASVYGLETLALMYSLPYALLMWSMISFLIAFSIECYGTGDLITTVILSVGWPIIAALLVWCISASYENKEFLYPWPFRDLTIVRRRMQNSMNVVTGKLRAHATSASTQVLPGGG